MANKGANTSTDQVLQKQEIDIKFELKKLQRVIYLTDLTPRYVAGDPELFFLKNFAVNLSFIGDILTTSENLLKFLEIFKKAHKDDNLPRRITLFYVLAYALRNHSPDDKITSQLAESVLDFCRTDEEFFRFIKVFAIMRGRGRDLKHEEAYNKITTSMGRIIRKFLEKKTPIEFAKAVVRTRGYYGWQYKDLIKISHYKSEIAEKVLITEYVLFGLKKMKVPETEDLKSMYNLLKKWSDLGRPESNTEKICELVAELKANYRNISPKYIKQQEVWGAILPHLPVDEVMQLLPKFSKYDMLQPTETSIVYGKVMDMLTVSNVRSQKVNPLQIFIHLKNFEKGGKPVDPKLEYYLQNNKLPIKTPTPVPADNPIVKRLYKCAQNTYPSDPTMLGLNKRVVLALDVTDTDSVCFKQKNILCLEAQLALAMYFAKTEKNIDITVFDGEELKKFDLDRNSFEKNLKKLKEIKSTKSNPFSLFKWALNKKKKVDVFICLLQSVKSLHVPPKEFRQCVKEGFKSYQSKSSGNAKLVVVCLGSHSLAPFGEGMNSLTICGFCPEIPKVIHSFVKGNIPSLKSRPKK